MFKGLKSFSSSDILDKMKGKDGLFLCTIATTDTSKIPGITGAGATPELTVYTPAVDAELMTIGETLSAPDIAQTVVDGAATPTPAVLTSATIKLTNIPFFNIDAGSAIKPQVPYISLNEIAGKDISTGRGVENPEKIFNDAKLLAKEYSKTCDYLVLGESTPAGTTTAFGVLKALGYNADSKVSTCTPLNPHELKIKVVNEGIANANIEIGNVDPFDAVAAVGDPMIPAVAGLAIASEVPVILAGGTQMVAVCALIKAVDPEYDFSDLCVATTSYVANDETADILDLLYQVDDIALFSVDPGFEKGNNEGLKNYTKGVVKEGAGAGGMILTALLYGFEMDEIREKIEEIA